MFHTILPDSNPVAITTVTRRKQSESSGEHRELRE